MTTDMERELQARLAPVLDGLVPGPAPLDSIIRHGRKVRMRKRISLAVSLAAGAALLVAVPLALRTGLSGPVPAPPLTTHYHVTVTPPGPHSPPGLIASGTVNGAHWSVRAQRHRGGYLITPLGDFLDSAMIPRSYATGAPVEMVTGSWLPGPAREVAAVRTDVTFLRLWLSDGQVLTLKPVAAMGPGRASLVVFAVPDYRDVLRIGAFSKRGEISYAVPWTGHIWLMTERWLRPGQPALPRPQATQFSGSAFGHQWRQTLAAGPWGWCGQGDVDRHGGGGGCYTAMPPLRPGQYYQNIGSGTAIGQSGVILCAQVADSVAVLELTTQSGTHSRLRPHRLGGRSFVCFSSADDLRSGPAPQTVVRWAAYDRHGRLLGSGSTEQVPS